MCLNSLELKMLAVRSTTIFICLLLFSVLAAVPVHAEPLKVSLLLGDIHSRTAVDAVKAITKELGNGKAPGGTEQLPEAASFSVYPGKDIRARDLAHLRASRLIFVLVMGRQLVDAVRPELEEVIKNGGKVYAVGGSCSDEERKMGFLHDQKIIAYYKAGTPENIKNMVLYALNKDFSWHARYGEPVMLPDYGVYEPTTKKVFGDVEPFRKVYFQQPSRRGREERPWVGVFFYKSSIESGQTKHLDAVIESLEGRGYNVLPVYGHPPEVAMERFFLSPSQPHVRVIVAIGAKITINPAVAGPLLSRLKAPVINAITLYNQSEQEWRKSPVGLDIFERSWQVAGPETGGMIQPTVMASKEKVADAETGIDYVEDRPIPERIERLSERVRSWINLQDKPNRDKHVALIYYNYPPGKQNIGGAYLNVLPDSLYGIITRLRDEDYNTGDGREIGKDRLFNDVHAYGRNIGNWAPGEIDKLVRTGKPVLISVETYKQWFAELPEGFRKSVLKSWGPVEQSSIMTWRGAQGKLYLIIPAVRYGNILLTPQPSRGWEQDTKKLFHDVTLAPHHQYVAFYLWLKKGFKADAVAHIGTHGTHEWLSGKEVGFTGEDPPEALIQDLPNIYPYIVDDVGEGLQAKRRGMAVVIDYMTPPFDRAGLNRELKDLVFLLNDHRATRDKSPSLAATKLHEINVLAKRSGLLTDLKKSTITTETDLVELEDYITEVSEKLTPFGLHTFGTSPDKKYRRSTAEAVLSVEKGLGAEEREKRIAELEERIVHSGQRELDSFAAALSGQYIPAGQGNDPIRNPDSLPTGKNFYSFDPTRIPAKSTYETGEKLARDLIEGYRQRNGIYPDKLTFNLWATETARHEGVMESQIMYLMGVRPKWDERGRVTGVVAIPRQELGRQRIDVTMVPSGLYRDLFSNLMALLDSAVTVAREEREDDNLVRANIMRTKKMLVEKGLPEDKAERLASVHIFSEPSGAYGTNLDRVIALSNMWDNEQQVADVYFMRMSHLYGQGYWGETSEHNAEDLGRTLLKRALSGTKMAVHSRSTNLIGTLDTDDFFQYLGGTALAIRSVDGKTPEVYVTDMSNPRLPKQETLEKVMAREMRSRYLNPAWIQAMMKEGYAGARFVDKVVEHLWGWQVTVPEAVDGARWREMYETYVLDRNGLNIQELFRKARNMYSYQSLVARMLETVRKDYWKADKTVVETLAREYALGVREVGLVCCDHTCNNPQLTAFTAHILVSVPGLKSMEQGFMKALDSMKHPEQGQKLQRARQKIPSKPRAVAGRVPDGKGITRTVAGYEMKEIGETSSGASSAPIPYLFILGFIAFIGLVAFGFRKSG